jgi:DNA-binding NarL/FixJ family response regulator
MEDFAEITVLIADRATLFRYGLLGLLRERRPGWSCAEAHVLDEVMAHLRAAPVDVVLLDLQLLEEPRAANLRRLREQFPQEKIVVLAETDERMMILDCLSAGANGYILKSTTTTQLLQAIEIILSCGVFAPAALAGGVPAAAPVVREVVPAR